MVNITLLCVGKLKEHHWREACEEYEKRLGAFCKLRLVEVAEERLPDNPSAAQIAATVEAEGERLIAQIPKDSAVISFCQAPPTNPFQCLCSIMIPPDSIRCPVCSTLHKFS